MTLRADIVGKLVNDTWWTAGFIGWI